MLWEWRGIANMDFIQLGGSSRVGEMILARERSGFAGEKKCLSDESLVIPIKELRLDDKLNFVEEPVEIMD
ncbi:hypothetical protein Tco_1021460 [Tanacetum coccineum]